MSDSINPDKYKPLKRPGQSGLNPNHPLAKLAVTSPDNTQNDTSELGAQQSPLERAADHLYGLDGDCPPELYHAISTLRQLINEEYAGDQTISSQIIFDILSPAIAQREQAAELRGRIEQARAFRIDYASYLPPSANLSLDKDMRELERKKEEL